MSEQVSYGHPDNICNQISDVILIESLQHDHCSRVAAECQIKGYEIVVAGEITPRFQPDDHEVASTPIFQALGNCP